MLGFTIECLVESPSGCFKHCKRKHAKASAAVLVQCSVDYHPLKLTTYMSYFHETYK